MTDKKRRKADQPIKFGKLQISSRAFRYMLAILCATAIMIFSVAFEIDLGFVKCGMTPQKIPVTKEIK